MKFECIVILLSYLLPLGQSGKILYVFPFSAKSHYIAQKDLPLELARRGHEVYVISAYKEKDAPPTYHQLQVEEESFWTTVFDKKPNLFTTSDFSFPKNQDKLYQGGQFLAEKVFNSTDVQKLMAEDHKFDVVINELFVQEALYFFAHKYQAPLVLVSTFGNAFRANYFSRNPLQMATVYHEYGRSPSPYSFLGRLNNFYNCMTDLFILKFLHIPRQEKIALKNFKDLPQPVPSLEEIITNTTLVLMNSHFSIDVPTAYLPNFVEVGGLNQAPVIQKLPDDLQKQLDDSKNGFIYLSFGSNVPTSDLGPERVQAILKVFGELKQTVFMKWEEDDAPDNLPKNVIIKKWFPQKEVLAHPNIKLFICHGGLIGLLEAIYAGVPIVGIPVFSDQYINILHTVESGFGELLEHTNINEDNFRSAVTKVINNKTYNENAKTVSRRFKDRPMSGLDTAVWWIEYVIRNKGASFIKSPALKLNFIEYNMFDVYAIVIAAFVVVLFVFYKLIALIFGLIFTRKVTPKRKQKKQ